MSRADLIKRVSKLKLTDQAGSSAQHRALLLLWALGQTAKGQSRLQPWQVIEPQLTELIMRFTDTTDPQQAAAATFVALQKDRLWEVQDPAARPVLESLDGANPLAGITETDHLLLLSERGLAAELAALLILRFFNPLPEALLGATGLDDVMAGRVTDWLQPRVGERFDQRKAIYDVYGGQKIAGIGPLRDGILNCFSKDNGPYRDGRIEGTDWIAYVGDGTEGDQELKQGNALLATYQKSQRALRFWHKPVDGPFTFESWVVIVQRRLRWGHGQDGKPRREFVWVLAPVPSPMREEWPQDLLDLTKDQAHILHNDADVLVPAEMGTVVQAPAARYRHLCNVASLTAEQRGDKRSRLTQVERLFRSPAAREAVLIRSKGKCENPDCYGQSTERTGADAPILEVDHVNGLARTGEDEPEFMIALCPNCHALKTRGADRRTLTRKLRARAKSLHADFVAQDASHS